MRRRARRLFRRPRPTAIPRSALAKHRAKRFVGAGALPVQELDARPFLESATLDGPTLTVKGRNLGRLLEGEVPPYAKNWNNFHVQMTFEYKDGKRVGRQHLPVVAVRTSMPTGKDELVVYLADRAIALNRVAKISRLGWPGHPGDPWVQVLNYEAPVPVVNLTPYM